MSIVFPERNIMDFPDEDDFDDDYINDFVDWGMADDGTPNPPPCPICGAIYQSCI